MISWIYRENGPRIHPSGGGKMVVHQENIFSSIHSFDNNMVRLRLFATRMIAYRSSIFLLNETHGMEQDPRIQLLCLLMLK